MSHRNLEPTYKTLYKTLPPVLSPQDQYFFFARFYMLRLSIWRQKITNTIDRDSNLIFSCGSEKLQRICSSEQFKELQILERLLVERNLRLAAKIVFDPCFSGYRRDQDVNDLLQMAFLGLYPAVIKYDFKRGVPFSSFARLWIKKYVYKQGSVKTFKGHRVDVDLFNYDFNTTTNCDLYLCKKRGRTSSTSIEPTRIILALEPAFIEEYSVIGKVHQMQCNKNVK